MMNKENKIILLLFIPIFAGCTSPPKNVNEDEKNKDIPINNWAKDSCGCMNLRNEKLAIKLIKDNNLMNDTKESFLKIFHKPNQIIKTDNKEILAYYFNSTCPENKFVLAGDKCYAKFYFKTNKLAETDFICE